MVMFISLEGKLVAAGLVDYYHLSANRVLL